MMPLLRQLSPNITLALNTLADEAGQLGEPSLLNRTQRRLLRDALEHPEQTLDLPLARDLHLVRRRSALPSRVLQSRTLPLRTIVRARTGGSGGAKPPHPEGVLRTDLETDPRAEMHTAPEFVDKQKAGGCGSQLQP